MNELKPARVGASMARAVAVVDHMTGPTIVRLMRLHRVSIRDLASAMNVTLTRVREVREHGVRGVEFVWDWAQGISGKPHIDWADVATLYANDGLRRLRPREQAVRSHGTWRNPRTNLHKRRGR